MIDVSALATITQQGSWTVYAQNGGEVKLSALTSLTSTHGISLNDTGGSTLLDANLTSLSGVNVTIDGTDAAVANSWTKLTGGDLTVDTGSYSLPLLTDLDTSNLIVQSGGSLTLAGMHSYAANGTYFQATGAGSLLDVSALTSLTYQGSWNLYAQNGGEIKAPGLTNLTSNHGIGITDTGGSTLVLSGVTTLNGSNSAITINDTGNSSLALNSSLTTLLGVNVTLDGTDAHVADHWTTLTNGNLTVDTGSYTLPGLTDLDGSYLITQDGGSLTLPGMRSYASNGGYFQATGAGSVLDVSALTTLTQTGSWTVYAQNGGDVKLTGLTTLVSTHGITLNDTAGSTLSLTGVTSVNGSNSAISITDTGNSGLLLNASLTNLPGVNVTLDGTDAHVADNWTKLTGGELIVETGSYTLPNLTDLDGSYLIARIAAP